MSELLNGVVYPKNQPLPKLDILLDYLQHQFDGYPYHPDKDPKYFNRLIGEFTDMDIEEELKQYHAWTLDQPEEKKIYYRSRFRSWLKTSRQYQQQNSSIPRHSHRRHYAKSRW